LEGFDDEWTFLSPGEERMAYYYDLPTGGYIFRVTACNADGVWNQTGASVTFTLKSFFFETLFFKIIVFILFAGIAAVLFYIYKKRPFDKKREKKGDKDYLPPGFVRECTGRIKHAIEKEKVYLDPEMTLRIFAAKINIPYYKLSLIINEEMKCSFTDYINSFRIKEAKDILANSGGKLKRITDIAFEVGFNSHSAFHKAFKKATGYSPKQHRKECIKK
jgi:AraC-like DNA-binding protein